MHNFTTAADSLNNVLTKMQEAYRQYSKQRLCKDNKERVYRNQFLDPNQFYNLREIQTKDLDSGQSSNHQAMPDQVHHESYNYCINFIQTC